MSAVTKENKEIRVIGNMMFYGQLYKDEFQVLDSKEYTERSLKNWVKKYGF